jgi:NAD(P)H dehydrogenase (quinone)
MVNISIVHHSITGTTSRLAASVLEGAASVDGCLARALTVDGKDIVDGRFKNEAVLRALDTSDAMVFGCSTYMGGPSAQFKALADASSDRWESQHWEGKLCAGFTVGSSPSGDQLATLQYFSLLAAQHGMLWVGLDIPGGRDSMGRNPLGAQLGLISQTTNTLVAEIDLITAKYFGERVARKALILAGKR